MPECRADGSSRNTSGCPTPRLPTAPGTTDETGRRRLRGTCIVGWSTTQWRSAGIPNSRGRTPPRPCRSHTCPHTHARRAAVKEFEQDVAINVLNAGATRLPTHTTPTNASSLVRRRELKGFAAHVALDLSFHTWWGVDEGRVAAVSRRRWGNVTLAAGAYDRHHCGVERPPHHRRGSRLNRGQDAPAAQTQDLGNGSPPPTHRALAPAHRRPMQFQIHRRRTIESHPERSRPCSSRTVALVDCLRVPSVLYLRPVRGRLRAREQQEGVARRQGTCGAAVGGGGEQRPPRQRQKDRGRGGQLYVTVTSAAMRHDGRDAVASQRNLATGGEQRWQRSEEQSGMDDRTAVPPRHRRKKRWPCPHCRLGLRSLPCRCHRDLRGERRAARAPTARAVLRAAGGCNGGSHDHPQRTAREGGSFP